MPNIFQRVKNYLLEHSTEPVEPVAPSNSPLRKKPSLKSKFPLQKGDRITMRTGEQYLIKGMTVRGIYHINCYYLAIYDAKTNQATTQHARSFTTLRELNEYLKSERHQIQSIDCKNLRVPLPSVDACHAEALLMETARNHIRKFLK